MEFIFSERNVKCIVDWLFRIVYEESLVYDIGRACLMEVEYKSRWWARCNHVCDNFGLWEPVNLLWLRNIKKEGMAKLGMKYDRNVWKKTFVSGIQEYGSRQWRNGFGINEREQQYVHMKSQPKNDKYVNGSVVARVRLMVRGGCLPVVLKELNGNMMMISVCIGQKKQRSMCPLSVNTMTW